MRSFRQANCSWPGALSFPSSVTVAALAAVLFVAPADRAGAQLAAVKKPGKTSPAKGRPQPSFRASPSSVPRGPLPEYADGFPSEPRITAPDLLLTREDERRAVALSEFAQALVAEDNADSEKALAGFRKALDADPSYTELAIKIAFELARRNDVPSGIQILKDAIKATPKEAGPLVFLSQLYAKNLKKPALALKYAEQALALAPDNIACYLAIFELHTEAGQLKKAEQLLDRGVRLGSVDAKFNLQLGDLYARLFLKEDGPSAPAELEKMNAVYRRAAELSKADPGILAKVGDYFIVSRQAKEALPFYKEALAQKGAGSLKTLANLREKLARAYLADDQRLEAINLLEEITRDNPMRFETFELLGELYEQKGDLEKALRNYEHSLLLDATEPRNYLRFTEMLLRAKRFEKAVETMEGARKRFRDRPDITFSLAMTLSQAKKHTQAMTVFAEALGEAQNNHEELLTAQFYFQYGAAAEQAGLLEKATELLKRSIDLDPANSSQAYNYLGYMWTDRGENLAEATTMIEKALEMEPENGAFLDSLGWCFFKKGEHERALKELLRAVEKIKPEDSVVFDHLGDTYEALGKSREALIYWNKALALERENKKISGKIEAAQQKAKATGSAAPTIPPAP